MKEKLKIGFVGFGRRGHGMLKTFAGYDDVEVVAVCDLEEKKQLEAVELVKSVAGNTPVHTGNYKDFLTMGLDAVINCCSWADHSNIVIACLNAGIPIGFEVGGAYSLDECWEIVKTQERTGTPLMMLTNSRFTRPNMALVRMARDGFFGKIVHCDGGYCHYMTENVVEQHFSLNYYRLINYMLRCSENYPVHAMGTIADILNINRGNKIVSLTSTASCSKGIHEYILRTHGKDHCFADTQFAQGDIVTTTLKCARGETITLRLDTTLPRPYSRCFSIHGTEGMFMEDGNLIYRREEHAKVEEARELYNNADKYINENLHPIWQEKPAEESIVGANLMEAGHGGTDLLCTRCFIDSVKNGWPMVTDVYDAALFMALTVLSEESILKGGAPVMVPDFTKGAFLKRKPLTSDDTPWSIT